jgi:hypothetical protein
MSLDIDLDGEPEEQDCTCDCGDTRKKTVATNLFSANYTHNGGGMADAAGIYQVLWRAEENGIKKARQLIEPLRAGLALMVADPVKFKQFDSPNGWGKYEHFVPWVRKLLAACEEYPDANVRTSR